MSNKTSDKNVANIEVEMDIEEQWREKTLKDIQEGKVIVAYTEKDEEGNTIIGYIQKIC